MYRLTADGLAFARQATAAVADAAVWPALAGAG
jgi:hypothetical protein